LVLLQLHYYVTENPREDYDTIKALTHSRSTWFLQGLTEEISTFKEEQFFEILSLIGENPAGRHIAWRYVRRFFDRIVGL
jgi:hypothetical protein